jgi:hypothetical protein
MPPPGSLPPAVVTRPGASVSTPNISKTSKSLPRGCLGSGAVSRPQRYGLALGLFIGFFVGALTLIPLACPIINGDFAPTKILNVEGFGTFPYGPDPTPSFPLRLIIPASAKTASSSGPDTFMGLIKGTVRDSNPHSLTAFISASWVAYHSAVQRPHPSVSPIYDLRTTEYPLNCLSCSVRALGHLCTGPTLKTLPTPILHQHVQLVWLLPLLLLWLCQPPR